MKICKAALFSAVVAVMLAFGSAEPTWAWGAVAVGTSGHLAKDGFAFGGAVDQPSQQAARTAALAVCRKFGGAPKMAGLCKVVKVFRRQCYSLAFDPKPGMAGTGWAFAPDKPRAQRQAMTRCRKSAVSGRRRFCKLNQTLCDTSD